MDDKYTKLLEIYRQVIVKGDEILALGGRKVVEESDKRYLAKEFESAVREFLNYSVNVCDPATDDQNEIDIFISGRREKRDVFNIQPIPPLSIMPLYLMNDFVRRQPPLPFNFGEIRSDFNEFFAKYKVITSQFKT